MGNRVANTTGMFTSNNSCNRVSLGASLWSGDVTSFLVMISVNEYLSVECLQVLVKDQAPTTAGPEYNLIKSCHPPELEIEAHIKRR